MIEKVIQTCVGTLSMKEIDEEIIIYDIFLVQIIMTKVIYESIEKKKSDNWG